MNSPHMTKFHVSRSSTDSSAGGYAQYMHLEKNSPYIREDLKYQESRNLPQWAEGNPQRFFEAADQYEGFSQRIAEGWVLQLPRGLDQDQHVAMTKDFVAGVHGDQHPHAWVIHEKVAADGGLNTHVHLLMSGRIVDGIERGPEQFFAKYHSADPTQGGCEKSEYFTRQMGHIKDQRVLWADLCNWYCESAGLDQRYDPRTLKERGIDREPEVRLNPKQYIAHQEWLQQGREDRQAHKPEEQRLAAAYWEERKVALGSKPTIARLEQPLIGNKQSHIYHAPGHPNYGEVVPKNQVLFWSVEAAVAAGYRRAANDHHGSGSQEAMAAGEKPPRIRTAQQAVDEAKEQVGQARAEVMQEKYRMQTGTPQTPEATARIQRLLNDQPHLKRGMQPDLHEEETLKEGWSHGRRY